MVGSVGSIGSVGVVSIVGSVGSVSSSWLSSSVERVGRGDVGILLRVRNVVDTSEPDVIGSVPAEGVGVSVGDVDSSTCDDGNSAVWSSAVAALKLSPGRRSARST